MNAHYQQQLAALGGDPTRAIDAERQGCAAFLELLADVDAYASANLPAAELLRRVAAHMREREKWESVIRARRDAKKQLPWE